MNALAPQDTEASPLNRLWAQLAWDLVAGLEEREEVLEKYGIDEDSWDVLRVNPQFRGMVKEAKLQWNGEMNAERRIQAKSRVATEDSVQVLYIIAHDVEQPASARIEAVKQMARMAGTEKPEEHNKGGTGDGFSIIFNIGGESQSVDVKSRPRQILDAE